MSTKTKVLLSYTMEFWPISSTTYVPRFNWCLHLASHSQPPLPYLKCLLYSCPSFKTLSYPQPSTQFPFFLHNSSISCFVLFVFFAFCSYLFPPKIFCLPETDFKLSKQGSCLISLRALQCICSFWAPISWLGQSQEVVFFSLLLFS